MQFERIGNIVKIVSGGTPSRGISEYWGGKIPWVKISDMISRYVDKTEEYITEEGLNNSATKILPKGTLLISIFATVGRTAILGLNASTNQAIVGLIPKSKDIDIQFLKYVLDSEIESLKYRSRGVAQNNINTSILSDIKIPLPSLEEQKQIAHILDKADALRQKRKQSIQLLDDYLKSVFYNMFGDPVINNKKWNLAKFSDVGTLDRGRSKHRPRNAPHLLGGKYPLIQTGDIANSKGYIRFFSQTYSDEGLKQSKMWKKGTLCITIAANIAKTGILTFDACFTDSVVGFIPNSKTNVEYIQYWLSYLQKRLEDTAPESAQKNINLEILRKLIVPIPPISLQNQFANIFEQVEQTKSKMEESLKEIDNLFNSLMNKFFGK
ncbi:MAG TPA: restriction endonuclease subunit S [Ignavibacteria bacterium]